MELNIKPDNFACSKMYWWSGKILPSNISKLLYNGICFWSDVAGLTLFRTAPPRWLDELEWFDTGLAFKSNKRNVLAFIN